MDALQALHDTTGQSAQVVLVSTEPRDSVRAYVEKEGYSLPAYVADDLPSVFEGALVPRTFVVRPDGQVVYRHVGIADWNSEAVHRFLDRFRSPVVGRSAEEERVGEIPPPDPEGGSSSPLMGTIG